MAKKPRRSPRPTRFIYGRIRNNVPSSPFVRPFSPTMKKALNRARTVAKGRAISVGPASTASRASNFAACLTAILPGKHFISTMDSGLAWIKRVK